MFSRRQQYQRKLFYGTLSDGDLRRALFKKSSLKTKVKKIANRRAKIYSSK